MYSYVNKFNVAANQNKTEVVLNFMQEGPVFSAQPLVDENGNTTVVEGITQEPVIDLVVSGEFAKEIARLIMSVMDD